jgi:diacylglycerol kinase
MAHFLAGLRCAYQGIRYAWARERNIRIHFFIFLLICLLSFLLNISKIEFLVILIISAINFSLELANTAIERLADFVSPDYHAQIGVVKDLMAGAVLTASVFAVVIGMIIFTHPLLALLFHL